jgi:GWxTD domain-containing protein
MTSRPSTRRGSDVRPIVPRKSACLVAASRWLLLTLLVLLSADSAARAGTLRPEDSPAVQAAKRALDAAPAERRRYLELIEACLALDNVEGRREADRAYRKALLRWPRDTELLLSFAELKEERRFYNQARGLYRRALREAPDLVPARLGLVRLAFHDYRLRLDRRALETAIAELDRILDIDPDHAEALARSAFAGMMLGDSTRAESRGARLAERHPDDPRGHFFLMMFAVEKGAWDDAERSAGRALASLGSPAEVEAYDSLERLDFRIEDRRQEVTAGHRSRIDTEFWRRRDPTPATDRNERRLEHLRRVFMADQLYGSPESGVRGWETDAGEAVIRFGVPEERWLGLGAQVLYSFQPSRLYQRHRFESGDLTLHFDDPFLNGNWVEPFDWGRPSDMDALAALIEATMDHPVGGPPIDIALDALRFRDPDGRMRVDVVVAVPDAPDSAAGWSRPMAAYDPTWAALDRVSGTLDGAARVRDREEVDRDWLVDLVSFRVPADTDTIQIGTQVEVGPGRGFGSRLDRVLLDPLPGGSLALSDILLLDRIEFEGATGADGAVASANFARGGGRAVPHPTAIYRIGDAIPIYFELYDLGRSTAGETHYEITVEVLDLKRTSDWAESRGQALVDRRKPPKTHARVQFEERGASDRAERLLEVSVGRLPRGDYALQVRVDDRMTGSHATTETAFRVVRPPKGTPEPAPAP